MEVIYYRKNRSVARYQIKLTLSSPQMPLDLLQEIKNEYDLCINRPKEYQRKVDYISRLLSLKGRKILRGDNCPVYIVGILHL